MTVKLRPCLRFRACGWGCACCILGARNQGGICRWNQWEGNSGGTVKGNSFALAWGDRKRTCCSIIGIRAVTGKYPSPPLQITPYPKQYKYRAARCSIPSLICFSSVAERWSGPAAYFGLLFWVLRGREGNSLGSVPTCSLHHGYPVLSLRIPRRGTSEFWADTCRSHAPSDFRDPCTPVPGVPFKPCWFLWPVSDYM